jgi:hypothetical protein
MKLALLLLLAASGSVVLTDDVYQIPGGEWRFVRFAIGHRPATAECRFQTFGEGEARAELVSQAELESIRLHKSYDALASTDSARTSGFSQYIDEPGEYAVVVANPGNSPVAVRLMVAMSFGQPAARYLSRERQLTVILVSFAAFFAIVTFSARALLRAMKKPA